MKILPTLIACLVGATVAGAEEKTFYDVLGRATVKEIVDKVVGEMVRNKDAKYTKVSVEPALSEKILDLAGETKVNTVENRVGAATRLEDGVTIFFENYRDFVGRGEMKFRSLVLGVSELDDFFGWFKTEKGCGKIPCGIPPCCGDCDGCKGKE